MDIKWYRAFPIRIVIHSDPLQGGATRRFLDATYLPEIKIAAQPFIHQNHPESRNVQDQNPDISEISVVYYPPALGPRQNLNIPTSHPI